MMPAPTVDNRQSVLITGCSPGGIGNALAREFHRQGLRVFATARDRSHIEDLETLGMETLSLVVDNEDSVRACCAEIEKRVAGKGLDYLVNNAGRAHVFPAAEVDLAEARKTFETNFFGVISVCQKFLPLLIKAQGTIVQIGSITAIIPYPFGSVYNASKAAMHQFSDTMRVELAPLGVKVITVITGGVLSNVARTKQFLAPNSLYGPFEDGFNLRLTHSQTGGSMHATVYAKSVVKQLLYPSSFPWFLNPITPVRALLSLVWWSKDNAKRRTSRRWLWEGNRSRFVWFFAGGWAWFGLYDHLFSRVFGLSRRSAKASSSPSS